jgi:hypothetical protein
MYHIYQIYQCEELVLTTYHKINPNCSDSTKLDILLNSPATPYTIADSYFKQSEQFKIVTVKTNISNALEANEYIQELKNTTIIKTKKPRTKKAQQPKIEG